MTYFSKYRLKTRQQLQGMRTNSGFAEWCKEVGRYIAALILALILVQYITDTAIAEDEAYAVAHQAKQQAEKAESTWLSCLNHKGVWIDGVLHTCTLADTRLTKEQFK